MLIDKKILLQVQNGQISTEKAEELLRADIVGQIKDCIRKTFIEEHAVGEAVIQVRAYEESGVMKDFLENLGI